MKIRWQTRVPLYYCSIRLLWNRDACLYSYTLGRVTSLALASLVAARVARIATAMVWTCDEAVCQSQILLMVFRIIRNSFTIYEGFS